MRTQVIKALILGAMLTTSLTCAQAADKAATPTPAAKAATASAMKATMPASGAINKGEAAATRDKPALLTDKVSINSATASELAAALNGVGMKKAEAIISYREQYGPFTAVEQLREVPGMGAALVERNLSRVKL